MCQLCRFILSSLCCLLLLGGLAKGQTLGEALDTPGITWESIVVLGESGEWFAQTTETSDGVDAAWIVPDDLGLVKMQADTVVVGPKLVDFFWRVDVVALSARLTFRRR